MKKGEIDYHVLKVDERMISKHAGKFSDSIRYYDSEMQKIMSTLSYSERQMIPEYEARYVQERRSDADSPLDAACREKQYKALTIVFGVAAVLALAAYDAGHSFSLDLRDAGALSSYFVLAFVFFAFLLFGMRIRRPKKEKVDYSKMSSDDKLKLFAEYSYQKEAIEKMLDGGR